MKKGLKVTFGGLIFLILVLGLFSVFAFVGKKTFKPEFQKGMCYTSWSKEGYASENSDSSLKKLKDINVEWVSILTTWYQDTCFSTEIFPDKETPSDDSLRHAISEAHALGFKVMLKPHLDLISTEAGGWRGEISCVRDPDWARWFDNYKKFLLHYAKIAQDTRVEMLCVGTELTAATAYNQDKWREIIKEIRRVYKGDLTYAANWSDEYLQIKFWDALDYAGIDAYFPLSEKDKPTYEELKEGWKKWLPEIEAWQKSINKPVIFPEIGYRSSTGAARQPWEHDYGPVVDLELQRDCYRALIDTFWNKEWFYGIYWWSWGTDKRMGGDLNRGFTPQNKPAEDYIGELYKKNADKQPI